MALDRQEYPAILTSLQPAQAIEVLAERVRAVSAVNTGIADWLQERRRLEEQYSHGLRRLARRPAIADPQTLGVFATPVSALIAALDTLADTHSTLASKIESDVETPLRSFNTTNREMTSMGNIQGNLTSLAKDIDTAQKKLDKASKSGGNKAETARRDVEQARSQWESQAPFVFESLQALDETRLNKLRDVLTQFQTHEVDGVEKIRAAHERSLNVLLTVETSEEIKNFAERSTRAGDGASQAGSRRPTISSSGAAAPDIGSPAPAAPAAATTPARGGDDNRSQRSDSVSELPTPKPPKPRSGLRRLGTVLKGRRESKIPAGADRISETAERASPDNRKSRLPNSSTFSSFTRNMRSKDNIHSLEPPKEEDGERPQSPLRNVSTFSGSERHDEPLPTTNGANAAAINGGTQSDLVGLSLTTQSSLQDDINATLSNDKGKTRALDPITAAEQEAAGTSGADNTSSGAFKVAIKDTPANRGEEDDDAFNSVANTLRLQGPPPVGARKTGTVRGRRDNRASVYAPLSPPGGITPIADPMSIAPRSRSQDPSLAPQPASAAIPPPPTHPAIPAASKAAPLAAVAAAGAGSSLPASPFAPAIRPGSGPLADDAGSVRSGRSQSSVTSLSHRHPDLTSAGLNASIIETVSAWFEGGRVTKSAVIGEIALQDNETATLASEQQQRSVRISGVTESDKVAPNPAFISNDPSERTANTYALNLPQLGRGKTQVGFKYQLAASHPTATSGSLAPITIHPQWKVEATQTSAILSYSLNESCAQAEVQLKDVTLALHLAEGSKATTCMSKPVGTFDRARAIIYWNLGDVTLRRGDPPVKLLARFGSVDAGVKPGRAEARWTLEGAAGSGVALQIREAGGGKEDPFGDAVAEGAWVAVGAGGARRRLVAGTYQGS